MRIRPIHSAAVAFAATLAVTLGSPGPAEAFLPLPIPIPMLQQSQPPVESRSGRSPSDNNFRRGSDKGKYSPPRPLSRPPGRAPSATRRSRAPPPRARAESRRRNPRSARRPRAPAASGRSRLRARAAAAPAPRRTEKAPLAEGARRPPRRRPSPARPARTLARKRPVPPAPAAPSAIPTTRRSARYSRRALTISSSSQINRCAEAPTERRTHHAGPHQARGARSRENGAAPLTQSGRTASPKKHHGQRLAEHQEARRFSPCRAVLLDCLAQQHLPELAITFEANLGWQNSHWFIPP